MQEGFAVKEAMPEDRGGRGDRGGPQAVGRGQDGWGKVRKSGRGQSGDSRAAVGASADLGRVAGRMQKGGSGLREGYRRCEKSQMIRVAGR